MGNIGVYCASREGIDKVYSKVAHQTGTLISQAGHTLVYGGYELGLMGIVAKSAMANGGKVIGITLKSLDHLPVLATEIIPASNLSERKTIIHEFASPPNGMYKVFQTPGRAMEYLKPFLNI